MSSLTAQAPPPSPDKSASRKTAAGGGAHRRHHPRGATRRASANTRIFGHFMAEKTPRATWAVGVLRLEKDPGGDKLKETLWSRAAKMGRFRSRLVVGRWGGHWEELPEAELIELRETGYLWQEVLTDGNGTDEDLNRLIGEVDRWEYDRLKPLWRALYARKLADGSAALIFICSHGIGDGISLVATLFNLCDDVDLSAANGGGAKGGANAGDRAKSMAPGKRAKPPRLGPITKARAFVYGAYQGLTSSSWAPDPKNALSMPDVTKPSSTKRFAQAAPIPLADFKTLKSKFPGATINDIMMAVLTAAVRAYLEEKKDPAAKGNQLVRGGFPVNLRSPNEPILRDGDPMNKWAYGLFKFDFKYKNRIDLVWRVKHQIDKIKVSPSPLIQYHTVKFLMRTLPRKLVLNLALNAANLPGSQLSNVPGPQAPVHIAGVRVTSIYFYLVSPVGLYIGLFSYDGTVNASICVDGSTDIDAPRLAQLWNAEFEALKKECDAYPQTVPMPRRSWF